MAESKAELQIAYAAQKYLSRYSNANGIFRKTCDVFSKN